MIRVTGSLIFVVEASFMLERGLVLGEEFTRQAPQTNLMNTSAMVKQIPEPPPVMKATLSLKTVKKKWRGKSARILNLMFESMKSKENIWDNLGLPPSEDWICQMGEH